MDDVSKKEAWQAMRQTFRSYNKVNKVSVYVLIGIFSLFIFGLSFTASSLGQILNTLSIGFLVLTYSICFDSLKASMKENKLLRRKLGESGGNAGSELE